MIEVSTDWIQILFQGLIQALVPVVLAAAAWRHREGRPVAAKLFVAAAVCRIAPSAMQVTGKVTGLLNGLSYSADDNGVDFSDPRLQTILAWQLMNVAFDLASWSLIAWAILMRPDERARLPGTT